MVDKTKHGLFYTRDSGGQHETTPARYIEWALKKAAEFGVVLDGTAEMLEEMIRTRVAASSDLYLDYEVSGKLLSRRGLDALLERTGRDKSVSCVFIPRRDRFARPDDPKDALGLEEQIRHRGIRLVYMDKVLEPLRLGKRLDMAEQITGLLEFDNAGNLRYDLANKMIYAQITLAQNGFSTGGRAPYGFRRWLVDPAGKPVRQLKDGEHVRLAGHHVMWLPLPEEEVAGELAVISRIFSELRTKPTTQLARDLNAEQVPSPDSGRVRGKRPVSGFWHPNTIKAIATNPLLAAITTYGRRAIGDARRYTPDGPRELNDDDFVSMNKTRIVMNPQEAWITAPARFEAARGHHRAR